MPDLRAMTRPTHDIFDAIVLEGVLAPVGMIGFKDVLIPAESEMIRQYLIQAAHKQKALDNESSTLARHFEPGGSISLAGWLKK